MHNCIKFCLDYIALIYWEFKWYIYIYIVMIGNLSNVFPWKVVKINHCYSFCILHINMKIFIMLTPHDKKNMQSNISFSAMVVFTK